MAAKIDHTNCSHPRTPKGRAACRASRATVSAPVVTVPEIKMTGATARKLARHAAAADKVRAPKGCTIAAPHCENCGASDYESVNLGDSGYTACCNELISYDSTACRNHHGR